MNDRYLGNDCGFRIIDIVDGNDNNSNIDESDSVTSTTKNKMKKRNIQIPQTPSGITISRIS